MNPESSPEKSGDTAAPPAGAPRPGLLEHPVLRRTFGLDLRSLAAMRVGLGVLLLADLAMRAPFLGDHYSDDGILPRSALAYPSLHALSGEAWFAGALFAVTAVFAVFLIAGYRTRLATIASWVLLVSLQQRNPPLIDGGDTFFALLLFWGMFLPLGARASLDTRLGRSSAPPVGAVLSIGSIGLVLQLVYVYVFSAILKDQRVWLLEGTAVYYALHIDEITTRFGRSLLAYPGLLAWASRASFLIELFGPLLLFVPVASAAFRLAAVALFVAFHLGLALSFHLVLFPYVCIVAWCAFLPGAFWDAFARRAATRSGTAAREAKAPPRRASAVASWVAAAAVVFVFVWNLSTLVPGFELPAPVRWFGEATRLRQRWSMFDSPPRHNGWWVMPAQLADGGRVDLFGDRRAADWKKPNDVAATFPTDRMRKWLRYTVRPEHRDKLPYYAAWERRRWNESHGSEQRVEAMEIHYVMEEARIGGEPAPAQPLLLYTWGPEGERLTTFEESLEWLREAFPEEGARGDGVPPGEARG